MKNPITGIINPTGEPDSGKTWFAFSSGASPERTAFIDDDVKGSAIVEEIKASGHSIGFYRNLVKESRGMRELDFHNLCLNIIEEIQPGKYDVLIWDTWTRFENSFHPVVASNPSRFKQFYSSMGSIKGAEQWNASFDYEASILSQLTEKAPLVILTSHLKKDMSKRDVAESKKPLVQKSRMRVWLRHSPDTPEPTGLVLKRLSKAIVTENGMKPINVTHRKIHPFTWENLLKYWENPVGNVSPESDGQLTEFELSILDGILTKDQKDVLRLAVIEAERERQENEAIVSAVSKKPLEEQLNGEFPVVPKTWIEFLSQAMNSFGMTAININETLDVGLDKLQKMNTGELEELWQTLSSKNQK